MYERTRRLGAERRRLAAEWDNLIARIRRRPGLAGFLHPPSFAEIGAAAADGPVVAVCATPLGGLALLLTADDDRPAVRALPLPEATERKCRDRADRLSAAFTILGDRKASDEEKNAARDEANEVLGWLWDAITGPILDTLAAGGWQGGRLWWCPVGLTARLPLHAAGRAGAPGALDRVVSSYTPTIQALARSRARRTADTDEAPAATALVVAMSRTPNHPALDAASYEAERVRELVRNVTVLRDTEATGQAVLRELARHRIAHFACHSVSDRADPAKGRLLLHDHTTSPLTVAEIMRTRLPRNAELAYLSACRTADAGPRLADEAIHLTGAFQLAGYRHVIGTLWPVYDLISAIVAENVYRRLTRDGTTPPDTNTTASALRAAIRDLRETHPSRPDLWAGYVHVGP